MNARIFRAKLIDRLESNHGLSEAEAIARVVLEYLERQDKGAFNPFSDWPKNLAEKAQYILDELKLGKPVQYVLHESWFDNVSFYVDESVLIPRPETEELFDWIKKDMAKSNESKQILDIGTGSGILAISLKRAYPTATVTAIDISESALRTAEKNAMQHHADIHLRLLDFMKADQQSQLTTYDLIVSNPPYIAIEEKESMSAQVLEHEPWQALFVPNNEPLCFYRAIATFGLNHLNQEGCIYVELHEDRAKATSTLFESMGYHVVVRRDMQKKERMLRAYKKV